MEGGEGMNLGFEAVRPYYNEVSLTFGKGVVAQHAYPTETFVHVLSAAGDCLCGPELVVLEHCPGHSIYHVHHFPLDWRYYNGDWDVDSLLDTR